MYLEHFGFNEKPFTDEHWEEVSRVLLFRSRTHSEIQATLKANTNEWSLKLISIIPSDVVTPEDLKT